ncbi:hypothetical protein POTOM_042197 [Populus tomentosa]|uniref:Translation elongation factor EF1B beta/delta subunit guanine nucleotide exchange domain-containing protein n=1 Tax=Populus tomentosa TaxID=118781 RepID=A0A8X7YNZ5_POPTO|nr:hypothetical protein POTOM_042197 [Populus tomentosa]
MAVAFYDLTSAAGLKKLDDYLLSRSYISGYQASKDDLTVFAALSSAPAAEYVNVSRWYTHIDALLRISGVEAEGCGVVVEGSAPIIKEAIATPPSADTKARFYFSCDLLLLLMRMMMMMMWICLVKRPRRKRRLLKNVQLLLRLLQRRKSVTGKSSVLLDVKPWDDETDMKKLEEAVRSVEMEGLLWGASKLVPVGYGIKKMTIMLTIIDDLVSVDTLIEERLTVEPINEYVQSCDIVAFNKICKYRRALNGSVCESDSLLIHAHLLIFFLFCRI